MANHFEHRLYSKTDPIHVPQVGWKVLKFHVVGRVHHEHALPAPAQGCELAARHVRVVALDLPTSWMMANAGVDDFTARMFDAINSMMLDMLAAVARKDFEDRRRRQA
jgi:hypothetical protein